MAAIDYTICLHSEVFVTTQGGNFPHFLVGHRRFLYGGHSKTIRPDKRKLALYFDSPNLRYTFHCIIRSISSFLFLSTALNLIHVIALFSDQLNHLSCCHWYCSWKTFKRHMLNMRSNSDAKGIEIKRPNDPIYSFPCPDCMCRISRLAALRSSPPPWSVWKDKFCIHCFHPIIRIRFPIGPICLYLESHSFIPYRGRVLRTF